MRWLSLLVLLALTASADDKRGRFERFCSRSDQGRSDRGLDCAVCLPNLVPLANRNAFNTWTAVGTGGAVAPTITVDQAPAPDGSGTTADRAQFNSCAAVGQASVVYLNITVTAATQYASSVWVYGNGASGSLSVYNYDSTALVGQAQACAFTNGAWTQCALVRTNVNTTLRLGIGCMNDTGAISGGSNTGAADVFLWGAGLQAGGAPACFALLETPFQRLVREVLT